MNFPMAMIVTPFGAVLLVFVWQVTFDRLFDLIAIIQQLLLEFVLKLVSPVGTGQR